MKPSSQTGFTLIEILVAMVVLGFLSSAAFYFLTSQNRAGTKSTEMMKGYSYAKQKLDSLKVTGYDDLSTGSDTVGEKYLRSWHVTAVIDTSTGTLTGRKKIDLSVFWPLTGDHSVSLATLVSDDRFREDP